MNASDFILPPPPAVSMPIVGSTRRFAANRIFCVGRNYADHAKEMGHDPNREPPFFFMKPATALLCESGTMPYPSQTQDLHHEVELVVALHSGGSNIAADSAAAHIYGYAVGLDMTRRDLQSEAKKLGRPWETGKAFDHSAPCSAVQPAQAIGHPGSGRIELRVNGTVRQKGDLSELIWSVSETIAHLSTLFALLPGDLIFTGTPAGVGAVNRGDHLHASVERVGELSIRIA